MLVVVTIGNMRMPTISRSRAALYVVVAVCALVLVGRFVLDRADPGSAAPGETLAALEQVPPESGAIAEGSAAPEEAGQPAAPVVVHVVGAVRRPGLYRLAEGSRIADAVRKAGGSTRRARLALVNLAAEVVDGAQIVVPTAGSEAQQAVVLPEASSTAGPVRLSTATLEELDTLPGVGPVTAQRIIDYREEHGPFTSVEELDAVPGIGPARLEQLRELVTP